ncbi:MAG TPA: exosortase A [Stellaceae bacterium]|nr:exosortase A [Stellaceae bacterium]
MPSAASADMDGEWTGQAAKVIAGVLAVGAALLIFHTTIETMVETWSTSSTFNHDFLIVPICLYLGWRLRGELAATPMRFSPLGLAFGVLAALGWLVGSVTGTLVIQQLSLVAIIQGIFLTIYGWPMTRQLAFPLLFLYFAVPLGEALVPPLQFITAKLSVAMLTGVGIPVYVDGNIIAIPTGNFYVAEACSGIRYLIASIVLGTLFAGITYRSWWRRAAFIAISLALPIIANGIRAFGIILIAYLSSNELAVGIDHVIYGWIFFTVVTFATLGIGMTFREGDPVRAPASTWPRSVDARKSAPQLLLCGVIALSPGALAALYNHSLDQQPVHASLQIATPAVGEPWRVAELAPDAAAPAFAAPDAELHAAYQDDTARIYLHVGYYQRDRRNAQAVSSAQNPIADSTWNLAESDSVSAIVEGSPLRAQSRRYMRGNRGHIVWFWYWIDGRFTGNPYVAKLLEAKVKILGGEQASAIVTIDTTYQDDAATAERALRDFAAGLRDLSATLGAPQRPAP